MNQPTPDGGAPSLRARPGFVAVVLAIAVLAGALEISPASIALLVSERLAVDTGAVSWLVSVMLGVAVVASVPAGRVVHRLGPRRALAAASALLVAGGVASWWFATRGDYALVFLARIVAGGGFILLWNAGLGAFGAFAERATATSLFTASGPLGFAVGHFTAPLLAESFGWASPFLVYPLLVVVPALALAVVRAPAGADADGDAPTLGEVRSLLATRAFVLVAAMAFVSYSLYLFVNSWVPTYLDAVLGYSATQSGALVAVFPLLGAFSRLSGGLVADRVFDGERRPVVLASFLVSDPLLAAFLVVERSASSCSRSSSPATSSS